MKDVDPSQPRGTVSLVVCTYTVTRLPLLRDLLASVATALRRPDEIIVVVDRDRTLYELLSAELGPEVAVHLSPAGGLSAARNVGIAVSRGAWIAFADDDADVAPDWLAELVDAAELVGAAIAGGRIDPRWKGSPPRWYSARLGWVVGCTFKGLPTRTAPVRSIIGCNMLARRDVLEALGGFSTHLGRGGRALIGSEETELCIRAGIAGGSILFVPASRAWQVVPADRRRLDYAWRRAWGEGRSKARLTALHGRVLGVEQTYTLALLRDAFRSIVHGAIRRDGRALTQGAMLLCTFATTAAGYAYERVRSPGPTGV